MTGVESSPVVACIEAVITAIRYTEEDRGKKFVVMGRGVYRGKGFPLWRIKVSLEMTRKNRPDLFQADELTEEERKILRAP